MAIVIKSDNANSLWNSAFNLLQKTAKRIIGSRNGDTNELGQVALCLTNPRQRWVANRFPSISISFALAEVVWILNRSNDSRIINYWNPALKHYSGDVEHYYGAYGYRIGKEFGFDQLNAAYYALKNNSATRQVVIEYYKSDIDMPNEDGSPRSKDIPCNVASIIKIRDLKLEWTQIMRSNDIIMGLPYNFVQFTFLHELLAGWLNVEVGTYTHFTDSLHLYTFNKERFKNIRKVKLFNSDLFSMPKDISDSLFATIYERMTEIVNKGEKLTIEELEKLSFLKSNYQSVNNIMLMIGAYVARKLKYEDIQKKMIQACTNNAYIFLWNQWSKKSST